MVLTARVPIIKFEMIDSGLAFDVSWEVRGGGGGGGGELDLMCPGRWEVVKGGGVEVVVGGGLRGRGFGLGLMCHGE
jgi:hypothetical protein